MHEAEVTAVRKVDEKPDRVHGLRKTARFARLLKEQTKSGKTIEETLRANPFRKETAALIFPFLVLEAKSEKSDSSLSRSELQTASSIMTLLSLQQKLATLGKHTTSSLIPVTWFLSNKGEHWNVAIGFVQSSKPTLSVVSTPAHERTHR